MLELSNHLVYTLIGCSRLVVGRRASVYRSEEFALRERFGHMLDDVGGDDGTPREKMEYIERMSHELGRLAGGAGCAFLAYLLEMAAEEASLMKSDNRLTVRTRDGESVDLAALAARQR